jgi:hypothetical protein
MPFLIHTHYKKWLFLFLSGCLGSPLFAQSLSDCADLTHLSDLYAIVQERKRDASATGYNWMHRPVLYKMACIDSNVAKHPALLAQRMQLAWQAFGSEGISKPDEPNLNLKQLLRHSIASGYGALILEARRWKIDLNSFDVERRETLLDYIDAQIRTAEKQTRKAWLEEYRQLLLDAGVQYGSGIAFTMQLLAKKYKRIRPLAYGLFAVESGGKWGWVNLRNKVVVPLTYKAVRYYTTDLFEVSADGNHFYFVDRKGRAVKSPWAPI